MRATPLIVVPLVLATLAACAGPARSVGRGGAEGFVEGAFTALDEQDIQGRIEAGLTDPDVQRAVSDLAAAASSGAIAGVDEQVRREQLVGLARDVARAFSEELRGGIEGVQLIPDLAPMMEGSVNRMLDAALSGKRQDQIEQAVLRVLGSSADELARSLRDDLGPAMGDVVGEMLDQKVSPALIDMMLEPRFQQAVSENARAMSRGVVLGSNDALAILDETAERRGNKSFLDMITDAEATTQGVGAFLSILQTVALVALAVALVRSMQRMNALADRVALAEPALVDLLRARTEQIRGASYRGVEEPPTMVGPEPPDEHPPGG